MKKTICFGCLSVLFIGSVAQAAPYLGVRGAFVWLDDSTWREGVLARETEFDSGYGVAAALGNDYGDARLEGEIAYRSNDIDQVAAAGTTISGEGDVSALSFLVNGYYDLPVDSPIVPYVGVGLGVANVDVDDVVTPEGAWGGDDDTVFAYQFAAGATFELDPNFSFDASYRYFATDEPDLETVEAEYESHNFMVGLLYTF